MRWITCFGASASMLAWAARPVVAETILYALGTGLYEGIPYLSCKDVVTLKSDDILLQSANDWMKGFMSGMNFAAQSLDRPHKDLGDPKIDPSALKARLVAYCYENPDALLIEAGLAFYKTLQELPAVAD